MDALTLTPATGPTPQIETLLQAHFALMHASSSAESCHVMAPQDVFAQADVLICAHAGDRLVGIGAIRHVEAAYIEVKSMHTVAQVRGQGIGRAILNDLMARARAKGYTRMSLETGSTPEFAPARALYAASGFEETGPFGAYVAGPLVHFMTRRL